MHARPLPVVSFTLMNIRLFCTFVTLYILFLLPVSGRAATYTRTIEKERLIMRAPVIEYVNGGVVGYSRSVRQRQVRVLYGKQSFRAQRAVLRGNAVSFSRGFDAQFKNSTLTGNMLLYDFDTNHFDGKDIVLTSDWLTFESSRLQYQGDTIQFFDVRLGLRVIDLAVAFDHITLYPGWGVVQGVGLETFERRIYHIPIWVIDNRRNAFQIPYPLPEIGTTKYRGDFWTWNTHYYFNPMFYGFTHFGGSQYKGAMVGLGQIVRLNDQDQFYLGGDFWQMTEPQLRAEYNHSFLKLPPRKRRMTFEEMLDYNMRVKDLDSSDIRVTVTKREEINDEEVDRDPEFGYTGHFVLTPKLGLDLTFSSGQIYEYSTMLQAMRTNSNQYLTYQQPVWIVDPLTWVLGYERSDYALKPFTWQMIYGSVEWQKDFWLFLPHAKYTHYFYDEGGSPFIFDQKYRVPNDNILYGLRFGKKKYHIGIKFLQDTVLDQLVDTTTYLGWMFSGGWVLQASYSTQRQAFSTAVMLEMF